MASRGLKDKNVKVYSLGIGPNVDLAQLEEVASSADNIFTAPNFDELIPVADTIVQNTCPGRLPEEKQKGPRSWSKKNAFLTCFVQKQ